MEFCQTSRSMNFFSNISKSVAVVKNPPANAGDNGRDTGDTSSIPGSRRSPGVGNGNPLQCSCLENSMDRKAWWATVHVAWGHKALD